MAFKFILICALMVTSIYGLPSRYSAPPRPTYSQSSEEGPAKYDFEWAVNDSPSANHFGQEESRDDDNTKGSYYVLLPDGRTQKVTYYVDGDSGFIVEVEYEGEARYSAPKPKPTYG